MQKNVANQRWRVVAFNAETGLKVTGDADNITAKISIDHAAAAAALTDTNPTETEDGYYLFDLTQAETNGNNLALYPESSTSNVVVLGDPPSQYTLPALAIADQVNITLSSTHGAGDWTVSDTARSAASVGRFVPTYLLLEKIKYKAAIAGIDVTFTEESYTSKASFYDRDPLPKYGELVPEFSGKRKYRGLYVSKGGFAINADVNGSLNVGRKVIPEFLGIGDRSLAARPVVINPLKA